MERWLLEKRHTLTDLYATTGNRVYLVGSQDGGFPDIGHHLPGEMGGLWNHPIKLLDGFWAQVDGQWLLTADRFSAAPHFNRFHYQLDQLTVEREQFVPDGAEGLVLTYRLRGRPGPVTFTLAVKTELCPVWLAEAQGLVDAPDELTYDPALRALVGADSVNPWHVVVGTGQEPVSHQLEAQLPVTTLGQGAAGSLTYELLLDGEGQATMTFVMAGSYSGFAEAAATYRRLLAEGPALFEAKAARYAALAQRSELAIPDPVLQECYEWIKFNYDALVREVPEQGRALGAGLPTYPWWFSCDNSYALLGLLPLGDFDLAKETLRLLARLSLEHNGPSGRIIHEATTLGHPFNLGNTQETPHFVKAVYQTWRWSGDEAFLRELYPLCKAGVLGWLLGEQDPDGDLFASGYGIIEIEHLNLELIDTAVYTYEALLALAEMAAYLGEATEATLCRQKAAAVKAAINERFWLEGEGLYADLIGPKEELLWRLQHWLVQAEATGQRHLLPYLQALCAQVEQAPPGVEVAVLLKNWVINTPLEAGLAPRAWAERALSRLESAEFTGRDGLYLSGLVRTEMMSISSGVQAVAEATYGRFDQALRYMHLIARGLHWRSPGSPSEMSPDYGCFVQAWSGYGIVWPLMQFLGLVADAPNRTLQLAPRLPAGWPYLELKQLRVGETQFDLEVTATELVVRGGTPDWTLQVYGQVTQAGQELRVPLSGGEGP